MFEILPNDRNLKPIFTQKWMSVDMNWGGGFNPNSPTIPTLGEDRTYVEYTPRLGLPSRRSRKTPTLHTRTTVSVYRSSQNVDCRKENEVQKLTAF